MNNSGDTQNGQNGVGATDDVVLSSMTKIEDFDNDIWIGDSGPSCHYCNNDAALYDSSMISEDITVGNGNVMTATKMGKLQCQILQKNGESLVVTLEDVKFVPNLWIHLFSIGKALKNGFNLGNDGETIKLMKGKTVILFDRCLNSKNGFVPAIKMKAALADIGATVVNAKNSIKICIRFWVIMEKQVLG
jgi:hypothetical protein